MPCRLFFNFDHRFEALVGCACSREDCRRGGKKTTARSEDGMAESKTLKQEGKGRKMEKTVRRKRGEGRRSRKERETLEKTEFIMGFAGNSPNESRF